MLHEIKYNIHTQYFVNLIKYNIINIQMNSRYCFVNTQHQEIPIGREVQEQVIYKSDESAQQHPYQPGSRVLSYAHNQQHPINIKCPGCNTHVLTEIKKSPGSIAYFSGAIMAIFLPLFCWIPCCFGECKDIRHYCPKCHLKVGTRKANYC